MKYDAFPKLVRAPTQRTFAKGIRARFFGARTNLVGATAYCDVFTATFALHSQNLFAFSVHDLIKRHAVVVLVEQVDAHGRWTAVAGLHAVIDREGRAILQGVVVHPDRMSEGLSKLAVAYAIERLGALGVLLFGLTVRVLDDGQPAARPFRLYVSQAFKPVGAPVSSIVTGSDADRHLGAKGEGYAYLMMHGDSQCLAPALRVLSAWSASGPPGPAAALYAMPKPQGSMNRAWS